MTIKPGCADQHPGFSVEGVFGGWFSTNGMAYKDQISAPGASAIWCGTRAGIRDDNPSFLTKRRRPMTQRVDYNSASPAGMKALGGVYGYVAQSGLPKQLIDLVFLRVSQINGCAFCIDMHSRDLLVHGLPIEKLVLVPAWREAGALFGSQERAALAWAETVTRVAETGVPDTEYEAAAAVFDQKQLTDLTIAVGLMNTYNRMAISFRAMPAAVARL
jgi:AhpD family alkylhydroperoxidase